MKITPVPHGLDDVIGQSTGSRSQGLHMSDLYSDLYQDLEPKRYVRGSAPDPLRLEMGLTLETILEDGLRSRLLGERPPEQVTDEGIIYSPDLIIFNSHTRVGEIKLTWMSSREVPRRLANSFPPKFEKYFTQMKAYAYHLQVNHARLIAFFVNGDYSFVKQADGSSKPRGPELLAWDIEFTAQELKDNWQMLLNHGRHKHLI